ncbi:unnamed protein product, partial [Meganyctiphanes norvegica]
MIKLFLNQTSKSILQQHSRRTISKMVDPAVSVYKELAAIADLKGAEIHHVYQTPDNPARLSVQVSWSNRNLATLERVVSKCDYAVQEEGSITAFQPVPFDKKIFLSQRSESGRKYACVAEGEKEKDSQHVLIFGEDGHTQTIDLKAADKHGKVYADPEFSCLEWSPNETKLAYVAEKKVVKPTSFLVKPKSGDEGDGRGKEWLHRDDWGEQLEGKIQSVVCFIDILSGEVSSWELPGGLCPAQLVWAPDGESVVGAAYDSVPYRLGLVYCPNRDSVMFQMDQTGTYNELISRGSNLRTPRFSPDMTKLVFLRSTVGGPHCKCAQLCQLDWENKQVTVVIDIINRERVIKDDCKFYGVYGYSGLPRRCWAKDNQRVVFSSFKMDNIVSYIVDTTQKQVSSTQEAHLKKDLPARWLHSEITLMRRKAKSSVRVEIRKMSSGTKLTLQESKVQLLEVQRILNRRPLTRATASLDDMTCITPMDLIQGTPQKKGQGQTHRPPKSLMQSGLYLNFWILGYRKLTVLSLNRTETLLLTKCKESLRCHYDGVE